MIEWRNNYIVMLFGETRSLQVSDYVPLMDGRVNNRKTLSKGQHEMN